jgi:hypothetical protein
MNMYHEIMKSKMYHEAFHYLISSIPHHNLSVAQKCLPKYLVLKHHHCIYLRAAEKSLSCDTSKTVAFMIQDSKRAKARFWTKQQQAFPGSSFLRV